MICILEAELARARNDNENAEQLYEDAILLAKKAGHVQDAGICHELASLFFAPSNQKKASQHIRQAIQCFRDWGAVAVAERLTRTYPELSP